jgi:hypothetical protein
MSAELEERVSGLERAVRELIETLKTLVENQGWLAGTVGELGAGLAALTRRVEALAAAQVRTEEQVARLAAAQAKTEERLGHIEAWLRGESGRREGERFEAGLIRQALKLLGPGWGGSPGEPAVRQRLYEALAAVIDETEPEADPSLSDLIWWKADGRVAVVEAALVIDPKDVYRAPGQGPGRDLKPGRP